MPRPLKIGFILPQIEGRRSGTTPGWSEIKEMAQAGEEMGFDSLWLVDHLLYQFSPQDEPRGVWECWSLMAAVAAVTTRAELGTLVTCTGFRNPALLAKMADTVDEISGGRVILGLGAGYFELEYRSFGFPYDHRFGRFSEALEIIATLLREGRIDFDGEFYQARECELRPRGPRPNGLPIMIGTRGEKMLRLTAKHADSWNGWLVRGQNDASFIPAIRSDIDAACRDVGRDPSTLERTVTVMVDLTRDRSGDAPGGPVSGSPDEVAGKLAAFAAEGITHLQISSRVTSLAEMQAYRSVLKALDAM